MLVTDLPVNRFMVVKGSTQAGGCVRVNEGETAEIVGHRTGIRCLLVFLVVDAASDRVLHRIPYRWGHRLFASSIFSLGSGKFAAYHRGELDAVIQIVVVIHAAAAGDRGFQILLNLSVEFCLRQALRTGWRIG